MKKIIYKSFYFIHLFCFNILMPVLLSMFGESVKIDIVGYLGLIYFIMIFLNILCSYFYVKARIGKKSTIILTIVAIAVKILILWIWLQEGISEVGDDKMGIFMIFIVYGYFSYVGSLDVIFLIGMGVNLLIRRKNERKKLDS